MPGPGGRPGRSTGPVAGRSDRSIDVHKDVHMAYHLGRSTERSTDCKCPTRGWGRSTVTLGTVDRAVDRPESNCSLAGRPPGRPAAPESELTSVGRPLGRPAKSVGLCARLVHIGRPVRSTDHWSGRPSQSTARAWQGKLQDLKTGLFNSN